MIELTQEILILLKNGIASNRCGTNQPCAEEVNVQTQTSLTPQDINILSRSVKPEATPTTVQIKNNRGEIKEETKEENGNHCCR